MMIQLVKNDVIAIQQFKNWGNYPLRHHTQNKKAWALNIFSPICNKSKTAAKVIPSLHLLVQSEQ